MVLELVLDFRYNIRGCEINPGRRFIPLSPYLTLCFLLYQVVAEFEDVEPDALYDVLHDPEYRSVWDTHMLAAEDAGHINVNNDVGYYASEYLFSHKGFRDLEDSHVFLLKK